MLKISCYFSNCSIRSRPLLLFYVWCAILATSSSVDAEAGSCLVKREERRTLVSTEYGEISSARVTTDSIDGSVSYLLHFFTLDPNSLFLPVILHADMVFYVHTGSGKLSWTEEDELKSTDLRRGDIYRLQEGAVFFIHSNLETEETERQKLRIHAIFASSNKDLLHEPATGPYSSIGDMVLGFDKKVLQAAFMVPEEEIEELLNGTKPQAIIHAASKTKRTALEMEEAQYIGGLLGSRTYNILELNKKKTKASTRLFNLFKEDKDFENCNGWSTTVTRKKSSALKGTNIGLFMVNLTTGSMMGPHWNPMAVEIGVVLQGRGMVRLVCASISNETGCRNMRYEVEEGDIFVVPRFHAMAQMAFNNETLVFMGFSTSAKRNHPQFLAGQASVFRTLDKDVLAMSFDVTNTTMDQLLASQQDSVILGCISCAEEELRIMEEETEKERKEAREREEEEARKREEEEARKREEEEARRQEEERKRREEEEEEARRREEEEEEARKREEEAARREEEERKRREEEEEAARRREEEEERKRREEEERKRRQEEEAARREEEEERKRQEEEARKREEEAARREEEERKRREEEEEAKRKEEEERQEARQREEEEARQREQQQEKAREREEARRREQEQEEEEERKRQEEEERKRRQEEEAARKEEEARKREEEAARREEEERKRREEEEEAKRKEEEERQREEEQEVRQREEEEAKQREQQQEKAREREEARRREQEQEEEEEARQRQREEEEEEAAQRRWQEQEKEARRRGEEEEEQEQEEQQGGRSEEEQAAEEERRREEEAEREEEGASRRHHEGEWERWQEEEEGRGEEEEQERRERN